ncbi:hypothetical protein PHLCEN_2v1458 [Hermanssonia centrifuga]|uniref:HMG box domain-containing protein n=1 Tax=Hermanssonia centrifuga TaxID=98765 RepID=A0A2R6RZX2_9APHY|nr:hypothetical protein PHLCEN_2v1458 [Hermanssonia centrifuga]
MHHYHPTTHLQHHSANAGQELEGSDDRPRSGDREGSVESASSFYLQGAREDFDVPDDPHLALTSQTLNADGTPKRPMNAFMIFARKRRPQISAANQMMRTGDISKILSKEWNSMDMADKKFYLDQAKKLKDNFNSKYPDYVYRRRPNNSRKKKKSDSDQQSPTDSSLAGDVDEVDDTSPIEVDDPVRDATPSYSYRAPAAGSSSNYENGEPFLASQNPSNATFMLDYTPGHYNQHSRLSTISSQETTLSGQSVAPLRIPVLPETGTNAQNYSYTPTHSHPSSHASLSATNQGSQSLWDSSRPSRTDQRSSWSTLPALDTSVMRQRSGTTTSNASGRSETYSPHVPNRAWSSSTSSATSSSSGGASATQYNNAPFPTLASPFYPAQSPTQPSPPSHASNSPDYFASSPTYQRSIPSAARHEHNHYTSSPTLPQPSSSAYYGNNQMTTQWPSQYTRPGSSAQQRTLPSIQPVPSYSLQPPSTGSASPQSSASAAHSSHMVWDRSRYDARQ